MVGRIFSLLHEKTQAGGAKTQKLISEAACLLDRKSSTFNKYNTRKELITLK